MIVRNPAATPEQWWQIFPPQPGYNPMDQQFVYMAVRPAEREWNQRLMVVVPPAELRCTRALIFDKPDDHKSLPPEIKQNGFTGLKGAQFPVTTKMPDCGSVFMSVEYAARYRFQGAVVPFRYGAPSDGPLYLVRELRAGAITGWSVIWGMNPNAVDEYLLGYEQCTQGGPDELQIQAFNDPVGFLETKLEPLRSKIPRQLINYVPLGDYETDPEPYHLVWYRFV